VTLANSALQNSQKNIVSISPQAPRIAALALEALLRSMACPALVIFGVTDASSKNRNGCRGSLAFATRNTIDV
jgi:hypothetical protein